MRGRWDTLGITGLHEMGLKNPIGDPHFPVTRQRTFPSTPGVRAFQANLTDWEDFLKRESLSAN